MYNRDPGTGDKSMNRRQQQGLRDRERHLRLWKYGIVSGFRNRYPHAPTICTHYSFSGARTMQCFWAFHYCVDEPKHTGVHTHGDGGGLHSDNKPHTQKIWLRNPLWDDVYSPVDRANEYCCMTVDTS